MRRLASLLLAVVVAVTFMPFLGDGSYADTNKKPNEKVKYIEKKADGTEVELDPEIFEGDGEILNPDDATLEKLGIGVEPEPKYDLAPNDAIELSNEDLESLTESDENDPEMVIANSIENSKDAVDAEGEEVNLSDSEDSFSEGQIDDVNSQESFASKDVSVQATPTVDSFNVTYDSDKGEMYVTAKVSNGRISAINIDGKHAVYNMWNTSITNYKVGIRGCTPGDHNVTICAKTSSGSTTEYESRLKRPIVAGVYTTPTSAGSFDVYSTYFYYTNWVGLPDRWAMFIDYSTDGVNWSSAYGPIYYWSGTTISGLAPDTNYQVRVFYGYRYPAGSDTWLFGRRTGCALYAGTYQTGSASIPKVKSIKVKAYKVKKRRAGVYGWYTGYYFGSVKYYTYKIKVTVQFKTKKKKKPGLNGLYINGVWKPGNKKKYTLKLGPYANYSKPKGKKFNVYLYSAHSPGGYGGYSPMYSKTKKVK